jgi:hypothetical protein
LIVQGTLTVGEQLGVETSPSVARTGHHQEINVLLRKLLWEKRRLLPRDKGRKSTS